jgi:hypothetical protein
MEALSGADALPFVGVVAADFRRVGFVVFLGVDMEIARQVGWEVPRPMDKVQGRGVSHCSMVLLESWCQSPT